MTTGRHTKRVVVAQVFDVDCRHWATILRNSLRNRGISSANASPSRTRDNELFWNVTVQYHDAIKSLSSLNRFYGNLGNVTVLNENEVS